MVLNTNPVPVKIKRLETFLTGSTLELIGCDKQWHENVLLRESFGNLTKCVSGSTLLKYLFETDFKHIQYQTLTNGFNNFL